MAFPGLPLLLLLLLLAVFEAAAPPPPVLLVAALGDAADGAIAFLLPAADGEEAEGLEDAAALLPAFTREGLATGEDGFASVFVMTIAPPTSNSVGGKTAEATEMVEV